MSKAIKKLVEEVRDNGYTELDLADKEIKSITSVPILCKFLMLLKPEWNLWHWQIFMSSGRVNKVSFLNFSVFFLLFSAAKTAYKTYAVSQQANR